MARAEPAASSRRRTRESGMFVRDTPAVRSLERGLQVVRAFRPGITTLSNAELAERTGLPRATVSRLTATLVAAGFLEYEVPTALYRLGTAFLGFGLSVRQGSTVLQAALPLMREISEGLRINVGVAVADCGEIVYLDSVRRSQLGMFRHIVSGTRLPIAETALGRAWLGGLEPLARKKVLASLAPRYGTRWPAVTREIARSLAHLERSGYCGIKRQMGLVSIATPLVVPSQPVHAFNISYPAANDGSDAEIEGRYASLLLDTAARIRQSLS